MIVYIETNFVVEVALEQEQLASAEAILALAEQKKVTLAFPNFIFSEAFECIMRGRRERNSLYTNVANSLLYLQRSKPHQNIMSQMEPLINILKEAHFRQLDRLHLTFERLFDFGECVGVDTLCLRNALGYQQNVGLEPQDSIIYATVVADLRARPENEKKCFLSRDRRAFEKESKVKTELISYDCSYINNFVDGFKYIQHVIQNAG